MHILCMIFGNFREKCGEKLANIILLYVVRERFKVKKDEMEYGWLSIMAIASLEISFIFLG